MICIHLSELNSCVIAFLRVKQNYIMILEALVVTKFDPFLEAEPLYKNLFPSSVCLCKLAQFEVSDQEYAKKNQIVQSARVQTAQKARAHHLNPKWCVQLMLAF